MVAAGIDADRHNRPMAPYSPGGAGCVAVLCDATWSDVTGAHCPKAVLPCAMGLILMLTISLRFPLISCLALMLLQTLCRYPADAMPLSCYCQWR